MRIDVDLREVDKLIADMHRGGGEIQRAGNALIHHRSHELEHSSSVTTNASGRGVLAVVRWTAKHAHWVARGRGPVYPVRARMVRWVTPAGNVVFARRVGPARGQDYDRKGLQRAEPAIRMHMMTVADRIARFAVGR